MQLMLDGFSGTYPDLFISIIWSLPSINWILSLDKKKIHSEQKYITHIFLFLKISTFAIDGLQNCCIIEKRWN